MAGAGYKLFNTGDVLTAAQVNTYLNEQTVMVFASAAARTSALTSVLAEGMVSYLQDTNAVEVYNGSAWVGVSGTGDLTEIVAGTGITVTSGTGPIPTVALTTPVAATNGGTAQSTYATGDLLYASASNTLAKRAIGSTGDVLTVAGGIPTWAAPAAAASGLTKITAATFSNVASVSVDSVFSATYKNYVVIVNASAGTSGDDFQFQFRYSGNTQTTTYYGSGFGYNRGNTLSNWGFANTSQATLSTSCGSNAGTSGTFTLNVSRVGSGSQGPVYYGSGIVREEDDRAATITGYNDTARVYDGFLLKSSSSNITGSYAVYGVQA
jgi:hypothetical protein